LEFHLYLPQLRTSFERLVETARGAEAAGFEGMAGMDHMTPPRADDQPMYQSTVTNTWIAAHTERLKVSSMVLCDAFRHPAQLAREAVSLDHASRGRFELGIGWGSYTADFTAFGFDPQTPPERVRRLRETLQVLKALWAGESVDFDGEFHHFKGAFQAPTPLTAIPVIIGGSGPKTMELVREFADWWNLDTRYADKLRSGEFEDLRARAGSARVSVQQMVAYVHSGADRAAVAEQAMRRFGISQPVVGGPAELVDHFGRLAERGCERAYAWFCDFAPPETLAAFGAEVIAPLQAR
jgi:alkanesulfonate monooxygenase SsuD/methylene tetrahydromethanopterin reductase-like flavin-dependent oxidoreductase (luciferase family)